MHKETEQAPWLVVVLTMLATMFVTWGVARPDNSVNRILGVIMVRIY